jgi:magnesium transporter
LARPRLDKTVSENKPGRKRPEPPIPDEGPTAAAERTPPAKGDGAKSKVEIRTWLFNGSDPGRDFDLDDLPKLAADDKSVAWVDMAGYADSDLKKLAGLLSLHPISVGATLAPWHRPQINTFNNCFYLSVTLIAPKGKLAIDIGELDLFVGKNYMLSVHKNEVPFLAEIAERVHQSPDLVRLHTGYLLYIILDEMLDFYQKLFEDLEDSVEKIEETALRVDNESFLTDVLRLKRHVFLLGRLADQHRLVFSAFTRPDFEFISGPDIEPYFRDLQQRLGQIVERLFAARDSVNTAFEIYVSQMSHRTNQVLKLLAVVSTVLLPATLIVGFFGTSFPQLAFLHSTGAFLLMIAVLIAVPSAVMITLRARRFF